MTQTNVPRDEVEAALLTRRELGPDYEPAIVDSLVERIDQAVASRVQQELQYRQGVPPPAPEPARAPTRNAYANRSLALAIVSVLIAVPVTAAASASEINMVFTLAILAFVLAINVVYANGGRR